MNYVVPAGEVNRPRSDLRLQQRTIQGRKEGVSQVPPDQGNGREVLSPARSVPTKQTRAVRKPFLQPEKAEPERPLSVTPAKPVLQQKPGRKAPARAVPAPVRPSQTIQTITPKTSTSVQPRQPDRTRSERALPVKKREQQEKLVLPSGSKPATPTRPAQTERTRQDRLTPAVSDRQKQPRSVKKPEVKETKPVKPLPRVWHLPSPQNRRRRRRMIRLQRDKTSRTNPINSMSVIGRRPNHIAVDGPGVMFLSFSAGWALVFLSFFLIGGGVVFQCGTRDCNRGRKVIPRVVGAGLTTFLCSYEEEKWRRRI